MVEQVGSYASSAPILGDVKPFLLQHSDIGTHTRPKLLAYFEDPQKLKYLKVELAAVVDYGEPFVKAAYDFEGDGPLALSCYELVQEVVASIKVENVPNLQAVIIQMSPHVAIQQQLKAYAKQCIQPGLDYFNQQLQSSLKDSLAAFKAARLFNPCKVQQLNPDASSVDQLGSLPFVTSKEISNLKAELPDYLAKCEDLEETYDKLQWWKCQESTLPHWATVAKKILAVQPSSAAVERVFSLLNSSFGEQQEQALQDYMEASVMLRYNS